MTIDLLPTSTPGAFAFSSIAADVVAATVNLQIVIVGLQCDVPNEGQQFYSLSLEHAQCLRSQLDGAIAAIENASQTI